MSGIYSRISWDGIALFVRNAFGDICWGWIVIMVPFLATDSNLQICQHRAPTCCTKKMEESYQAAVRRERMENIQTLNFELKYMIVGHITAFQGRSNRFIKTFMKTKLWRNISARAMMSHHWVIRVLLATVMNHILLLGRLQAESPLFVPYFEHRGFI